MPYTEVMSKWKRGRLHSGSKEGPIVKSQPQAVAIMLSEKRKAEEGKKEYQSTKKYQSGGPIPEQPDTDAPGLVPVPTPPPRPTTLPSKVPLPPPNPFTPKKQNPPEMKGGKIENPDNRGAWEQTAFAKKGGEIKKPGWRRW